ncbi:MAG: ABC transporter ATP-binding protein [Candidatus Desantisbacteria bacterium]
MIIEANNITKVYKGSQFATVEALRGISFRVEEGELLSIMGQSGSGKSTLLHILGCLHKPTEGTYHLCSEEINILPENKLSWIRNTYIGFVFQNFHLLSGYSLAENVELPLIYAGVPEKIRRKKAIEVLERVGLKERITHTPQELSGGEQQRVAIARALVNSPKLILADEPTGNLDSKTCEDILSVFKGLHKEGITIILVTHNPLVSAICQRIIHLKDGVISSCSGGL